MYRVVVHRGTFPTREEAATHAASVAQQDKVMSVRIEPSAKAQKLAAAGHQK